MRINEFAYENPNPNLTLVFSPTGNKILRVDGFHILGTQWVHTLEGKVVNSFNLFCFCLHETTHILFISTLHGCLKTFPCEKDLNVT